MRLAWRAAFVAGVRDGDHEAEATEGRVDRDLECLLGAKGGGLHVDSAKRMAKDLDARQRRMFRCSTTRNHDWIPRARRCGVRGAPLTPKNTITPRART